LVTTPGSNFATLFSLLFEAVSGRSDQGLAGAVNRYARSDTRRWWDRGREEEDEVKDDNFAHQKRVMKTRAREIELCKALLKDRNLSGMAKVLLHMRIIYERQEYEQAQELYGPRQVLLGQLNEDQWGNLLSEAVSQWSPERIAELDAQLSGGKSLAARDVELGKQDEQREMQNRRLIRSSLRLASTRAASIRLRDLTRRSVAQPDRALDFYTIVVEAMQVQLPPLRRTHLVVLAKRPCPCDRS
jgi:hypothetical protein